MNEKALESFITMCDNMMIAEESAVDVIKKVLEKIKQFIITLYNKIKELIRNAGEPTFKAPPHIMNMFNNAYTELSKINIKRLDSENKDEYIVKILKLVSTIDELSNEIDQTRSNKNVKTKTYPISEILRYLNGISNMTNDARAKILELDRDVDDIEGKHNDEDDVLDGINISQNIRSCLTVVQHYLDCENRLIALSEKIRTVYN